ncbi:MAG: right-handed parallel beta-helix repeat-containing protein [candidate division Zixibacteria bacterium]|nr:right-handed parallel beta-helix repeat-containing protein [candidate division Zixibacteria bacterium]
MNRFWFLLCVFLGVSLCRADVIKIPADYPTIQDGISQAVSGDTVLLADGVRSGPGFQDITFGGKKIYLISENGPETAIIDCRGTNRAFSFTYVDGNRVTIEGITIRNGYASLPGGAVLSYGASPTFRNCVFYGNHAHHGGAVYVSDDSHPKFIDCRFTKNQAGDVGGSVLCRYGADAYFENCVFDSNLAANGAFLCWNASPTVIDCRFSDNYAESTGGAVFLQDNCSPSFTNCLFENNKTDGCGGGLYVEERCAVGGNSLPVLTNCTFVGNSGVYGAALFTSQYSPCLAKPSFVDCILAFNYGSPAVFNVGGDPQFSCTDFFDNPNGDWFGGIFPQATINGNFSADPLFCDAAAGLWSLTPQSPCAPANNACQAQVGAFGVGCFNRQAIIDPDTMYQFYTQAIDSMSASIYIGNLLDGHTVIDIDTASLVINGAITPTARSVMPSYPGFIGNVLKIDIPIKEFIEGYGLVWDTLAASYFVTGVYTDQSPFSLADDVTIIGHRFGDINGDGRVNIGDPVFLIGYIFRGGQAPQYIEMGDANGDGRVSIGDAVYLISYLFRSGPPPVPHREE